MITLHTEEAWPRIRKAAVSTKGRRVVAVCFLGAGAAQRLPLRAGDLLVVRFDEPALRSGLVSPKEVLTYLRRGVEVHAVANLHAKVYVFGSTAFVGSANVSSLSEHSLVEAVCESNDTGFVSACTKFVLSLRGDIVDPHFVKALSTLYQPPRIKAISRRSRKPQQSILSVVALSEIVFDPEDERALAESKDTAVERLPDSDTFRVDYFRWPGDVPKSVRRGMNLLCCTHYASRNIRLSAPARVLHVKRYRTKRGRRSLVYLAIRKRSRERSLKSLVKRVPAAAFIKGVAGFRRVTNRVLARKLLSEWPNSGAAV